MSVEQRVFSSLGEVCYDEVLDWGFPIYVIPKAGFTRCSALLAVSLDSADGSEGEGTHVKDQIAAQVLPRVIVEQGSGSPFPLGGAGVVAGRDWTSYSFSALDRFPEALRALLRRVFDPDLSPEQVRRVRNKLAREGGKNGTFPDPGSQALIQAYRTFYRPERMVLCVSGGVDPRRVFSVARSISPPAQGREADSPSSQWAEAALPAACLTLEDWSLSFRLTVFDPAHPAGPLALRRICLARLCAQLLVGEGSPLLHDLQEEGLADLPLRVRHPDTGIPPLFLLAGKSRDPEALCRRLSEAAGAYARRLDRELFQRIRLRVYGRWLTSLDAPEQLCRQLVQGHFGGYQPLDFGQTLLSLTLEEIQAFCRETLAPALDPSAILISKGAIPL